MGMGMLKGPYNTWMNDDLGRVCQNQEHAAKGKEKVGKQSSQEKDLRRGVSSLLLFPPRKEGDGSHSFSPPSAQNYILFDLLTRRKNHSSFANNGANDLERHALGE